MTLITGVALGNIGDRLRNLFRLSGALEYNLENAIQPVLITDDLRSPGLSTSNYRRWRATHYTAAATGARYKIRPAFNCVITRLSMSYSALSGAPPGMRLIVAGTADAGVTFAQWTTCAWTDNPNGDQPAIDFASNGAQLLGRLCAYPGATATGNIFELVRDLHLPSGHYISLENAGAETTTNIVINAEGYAI